MTPTTTATEVPPDDPRAILGAAPMGVRQALAVLLCFLLNALDGFDILAITFAAPSIAKSWRIDAANVGLVISVGLAGMVVGSLVLGPLADRIGRRKQILASLGLMAGGMIVSAYVTNVMQLGAARLVTGLGLGAMLASINAMATEFANTRRRDLAVSVMAVGYPVGGVLGGWASAVLLRSHGWESIFIGGGLVTAAMIPVVALLLPESVSWLATSGRHDALDRINRILRQLGHREATRLAPLRQEQAGFSAFLTRPLALTTIALTAMYAFHMMTFYYALGWVPSLVAALGYNSADSVGVSVVMNIGGVTGGLLLGISASRLGLRRALIVGLAGSAAAVAWFGAVPRDLGLLQLAAFCLGLCANGSVVGLYAMIARAYPTTLRASGTGFVIGFGRIGAALGPLIAGYALAAGATRFTTSKLLALGSIVALVVLLCTAVRDWNDRDPQ